MSHFVAIRPLSVPIAAFMQAPGPVKMEEVLAGPIRALYEAGQIRGPAEIQLLDLTSSDGRLAVDQLSLAANDELAVHDEEFAVAAQTEVPPSPKLTPEPPTAVVRKLSLVR
ncbi:MULTISPECIES: hypothetical protein [unclassified Variovorax]|uniref:hypothetical protein n=1 Tax=unclassified Variovorax TaxID=663243 RepID=UPI000838F4C0|nr:MULTISPECIES: hypothetical protein [unclassified Variovorax]PNG50152.1 hypothetical protein CHC06_05775 [Variovorax sp. B2]PNG51025.1 hypothetical protein CHC07_05681 [Variovorax sp. B4]VTU42098.1 hypothetical protein SRS16P1_00192 [Variovorax sp. SRS16]VTU42136.1 hypothetical protein E5P1_00190 [Variovorax sp. PBL-E5]VTU44365.1 hypothetical protein H6P1_00741 [Variovorax sp. PBL-H6]